MSLKWSKDASVTDESFDVPAQAAHYTETTVTGEDAQHSDLPTNDEVVALIQQRIVDEEQRGNQRSGA